MLLRHNLPRKASFRWRDGVIGSAFVTFALTLCITSFAAEIQWDGTDESTADPGRIDQTPDSAEKSDEDARSAESSALLVQPLDADDPGADITSTSLPANFDDLYIRLQRLENELLQAYGRIEELEHQVQTMRHEQRDRFVELDRRIREVSGEVTTSPEALATAGADTEPGMYRVAFAALESKEYANSKKSFEAMIERFPNGKHVPDAFYWLGELNLQIEPRSLEESRQNFVQLINLYPTHAKTPEAMFKLATVYHELGDVSRALEYLDRVVEDYPDVSAAQLAKDYAANLR